MKFLYEIGLWSVHRPLSEKDWWIITFLDLTVPCIALVSLFIAGLSCSSRTLASVKQLHQDSWNVRWGRFGTKGSSRTYL